MNIHLQTKLRAKPIAQTVRGYGGGGAGAGGNGTNGGTIGIINSESVLVLDYGGNGRQPSNYFIQDTYGIGGPVSVGGLHTGGYTSTMPQRSATLWRVIGSNVPSGRQLPSASNNTGHGGIGGSWYYRDDQGGVYTRNSYDIYGGSGGSGRCIISINKLSHK